MKILSLNIGLAKTVIWKDRSVSTGIFKYPTDEIIEVQALKLKGDEQADPRFHGGEFKSVYTYPFEHYDFWQEQLNREDLEMGMFGENLTTVGLLEDKVRIGDIFQVGTAQLMATQPRVPCFKLGIRFNDATMPKKFLPACKNGIYFKVIQTGHIQKGDTIKLLQQSDYNITIQQLAEAYAYPKDHPDLLKAIIEIPILPPEMLKDYIKFESQLSTK